MPTTAPTEIPAESTVAPAGNWETQCLNCGTMLYGAFCSNCGQRAVPPHPSLRELAGDAFSEFSGWDGKFTETVRLLVTRPGQLTVEFLEGRRARFISPLRLYLTCSLVYFLLAASTPSNIRTSTTTADPATGQTTIVVHEAAGSDLNRVLTDEDRALINSQLANAPAVWRPVLQRLTNDPDAFKNEIFAAMPKILFVLLPVFAAIVTLFYPQRRFAEHLYFAFHVNAFTFVALSISAIVKFTHVFALTTVVGLVVLVWVPVYWHRSFRRVYGGTFWSTMWKETGVSALYACASLPLLVILALWVASH